MRKTESVKILLQLFEQPSIALSTVNLVACLKEKMNKSTVYRVLVRLEDEGILHKFKGKDGLQWYAKREAYGTSRPVEKHPHFQCCLCGKTECIDIEFPLPKMPKYKIESAELLLVGQCKDCSV